MTRLPALLRGLLPLVPTLRAAAWRGAIPAGAALLALHPPLRADPPANVVVIVADDLGWHDLGVMGATDLQTPRIDALAGEGALCRTAYVTAPVCSPSRAGMLTGRHQDRFGHETNPGESLEKNPAFGLPVTEATLADRLKALGYATGWIGKSHLGWADTPASLPGYHPNRRGFDEFFGFLQSHHHYVDPSVVNPPTFPPLNQADPIQRNGAVQNETRYLTTAFAEEAVAFIEAHKAAPFFLYLPFNAAHFPLESTPELQARFAGMPGNPSPTRRKLAEVIGGLDDAVGLVLDALAVRGLAPNTLVIFTSDNGGDISAMNAADNDLLRGGKTEVYEGGIRVPFIVRWPARIPAGRVLTAPVSTLDILPTAVRAAGGAVPAAWQLDGTDLTPFLAGTSSTPPHPNLFWRVETDGVSPGGEVQDGMRALRSDNWKLVKPGVGASWELYDLADDEGETHNLADEEPALLQSLIAQWETWSAPLARPRWAVDNLRFATPAFVLEDIRLGATTVSYLDPDFLPGSAQLAFQDGANNLWRATFDPLTGFLATADGRDQNIDTGVAALGLAINGPQWARSAGGASVLYTKPDAALRRQVWRADFAGGLVRTPLTAAAATHQFEVRASQWPAGATEKLAYDRGTVASYSAVVADAVAPATGTVLPVHAGGLANGRWLPNAADFVYVAHPPAAPATTELARFSPATGVATQVTDDGAAKAEPWGFLAPELAGELAYAAIVDRTAIAIYRDPHDQPDGRYDRIATLALPAGSPPRFLYSLKPVSGLRGFNGVSVFSCLACENDDPVNPGATELWMFALGPDADHRAVWRVDAGGAGTARDPETAIGTRDVFLYYTRQDGANPSQLRLANTGLKRSDFAGAPGGFTQLQFDWDFAAGRVGGVQTGGTETTHLVSHRGKLFAGQGSTSSPDNPVVTPGADLAHWAGAQVLRKDSAGGDWVVDLPLADHLRVEAMAEVQFTTRGPIPDATLPPLLLASFKDLTAIGGNLVSIRVRYPDDTWHHSDVPGNLAPGEPVSFGLHRDTAGPVPVHYLFTGLSNGEVHRAFYDGTQPGRLNWNSPAPLPANPELSGGGPVRGLAEANGLLYAACGLRQDAAGDPVTGGLYVRNDAGGVWTLVYRWPGPAPLHTAAEEDRVMSGLTTVPDPRGTEYQSLLAARSWPGVIERIDPARGHLVTVELDVRDFFARRWNDDSVRSATVRLGYTPFTPVVDPVTGEAEHLVNVWIEHPAAGTPPHNGSHFLIRHRDGTYEAADLENFAPQLPAGAGLRATRCIAPSPFAGETGRVCYFGGHDAPGGTLARDTAWIMRGEWTAWPALRISRPDAPLFQLTWPALGGDWILESTPALGAGENWQPMPGLPTRTTTNTTLSFGSALPREFFRLRKP